MRRGFKAEAKRLALEVRDELEVDAHAPLNPYELAALYGVAVFSLSDIAEGKSELASALAHFTSVRPDAFSAAVIPVGTGRVILENCGHDPQRRVSTLAHEMAHVVLEHSFSTLLRTSGGECRESDREQEAEAAELSGELLIPSDAALRLAYRNTPDERVAEHFGVSLKFAQWRMTATGARIRAMRAAARRTA
ncbi:ImmA/IrrE family metallo-endopeptidase [Streptomyces sp. NPDC001046]|uniref:ImmA/IrrE family metallo-endopeptidase n=1 Tax=Streptomyces sp. NPDC001046 TaxID=3364543 RepID=UPI0036BE3225